MRRKIPVWKDTSSLSWVSARAAAWPYSLGLSDPDRFAGMCILSSWLREGTLAALGVADRVDSLPTLVHHGKRDEVIELERAKLSIALLEKLQGPGGVP